MKYFELDKEEKQLLKEVNKGEWKRVKNFKKAKLDAERAARNTLNKTRNINIRLSDRVVARLKAKAAEQGIPYQTLASSVLHQFVNR